MGLTFPSMFSAPVLSLLSVLGVSLLSLLGILFFLFEADLIERTLLYIVSFSTGALMGDVFLHILPDMAKDQTFFSRAVLVVLGGILFSFVVEKIIHWRHCHVIADEPHTHHHPVGVLSIVGESIHNFIDGIVIASSFLASVPIGVSTTLAVLFHEIPHEIGNFAVLLHSGYGKKKALLLNVLSASASILGTLAVLLVSHSLQSLTSYLLPFAAGNLLYIAGSDLIPELHKHTKFHQGVIQFLAMTAGMAFMYGMLFLE